MIKLTSKQRVYALRWAADYLEHQREQDTALKSLRYYADITEKYGKREVIDVDTTSGKDESVIVHICDEDIVAVTAPDNDNGFGYRKFL